MKKYGKGTGVGMGWHSESERHRLARLGIKTGSKINLAKLEAQYDGRKSFYGKANVRKEDDKIILKSYSTDVAYIKDGKAYVNGTYSDTTVRHIKEFLKQNGFEVESTAQIMKDYDVDRVDKDKTIKSPLKSDKPSISNTSMGTEFNLGNGISVIARTTSSGDGFNHVAEVYKNGVLISTKKVHYINRTWEKYDYESTIREALDNTDMSEDEKKKLMSITEDLSLRGSADMFKTVATIASLGEVFGKDKKEKNDWKARMIKAGLEKKGLQMPDDWDSIPEAEKEKRLNSIIKFMKDKKVDTAKDPNKEWTHVDMKTIGGVIPVKNKMSNLYQRSYVSEGKDGRAYHVTQLKRGKNGKIIKQSKRLFPYLRKIDVRKGGY